MKLSKIAHTILQETRSRTRRLSLMEAVNMAKNNCSQWSWGNTSLYRGTLNYKNPYKFFDPTKFNRTSKAGFNYYNLIIDNTKQWGGFPKRSKSVIATTDYDTASKYGTVYHVIPFDSAVFGVCPTNDIYTSFPKTLGKVGKYAYDFAEDLAQLWNELSDGSERLNDENWKVFEKQLQEMGEKLIEYRNSDYEIYDLVMELGRKGSYIYRSFIESDMTDFVEFLVDKAINPEKNRFQIQTYPVDANKAEVWTENPVILVRNDEMPIFRTALEKGSVL